jgi:hypothetical protein
MSAAKNKTVTARAAAFQPAAGNFCIRVCPLLDKSGHRAALALNC